MKTKDINIKIDCLDFDELNESEKAAVEAAKSATSCSYAPYSNFHVGAAALLANGKIVSGSNQENAAYPSGLCAERTTIFYANSRYPDQTVRLLAIAARNAQGFLAQPITPCGACRQVLLETEQRFHCDIEILLYGTRNIYRVKSIKDLLPLYFVMDE